MTTKFIAALYYSMLGGKLFLQIAPEQLIQMDRVNDSTFNVMLFITFMLWVFKFLLGLYDRYLEIRDKHKK